LTKDCLSCNKYKYIFFVFTSSNFQASTTLAGNRLFFWSSHGAQGTDRWAQALMTARRSLVMWVVDGCSKNLHETMNKSKQSAQPLQSIQSIRPIGLECHTERADQEETHRQIAPLPFPPKKSSKWFSRSVWVVECSATYFVEGVSPGLTKDPNEVLLLKTRWNPRTRMLTRMLMAQMSKHMVMQSRTIPFCKKLFEQSCACFPCCQSAVWSGKCRVM